MAEIDVADYVKFRKAYFKVGALLQENYLYFQKIEQNQVDIKEIIKKGWGY